MSNASIAMCIDDDDGGPFHTPRTNAADPLSVCRELARYGPRRIWLIGYTRFSLLEKGRLCLARDRIRLGDPRLVGRNARTL